MVRDWSGTWKKGVPPCGNEFEQGRRLPSTVRSRWWREREGCAVCVNDLHGFKELVLAEVRRETYGEDIGQNRQWGAGMIHGRGTAKH